jgi:cytochrome c oxidase cbb3-type subunit III
MMTLLRLGAGIVCCALLVSCGRREASGQTPTDASGPPPGIRYEAHLSAGDHPPPVGAVPVNLFRDDPAAAKSGSMLFTAMNCDGCHGGDGSGWVGPNLADGRWRYGGADEEIFSSIYFGRPKGMPAFGGALGAAGVWNIVAYLKSLPVPAGEATESWEQ